METLQKAIEKIKEQQCGENTHSQARMLGNQLMGMLMRCPEAAKVVLDDLDGESMSIQHCAAKLKEYADKISKKEAGTDNPKKTVTITLGPEEAAKIIADFYGITELVKPCLVPPEFNLPAPVQPEQTPKRKLLNLADFM